VNSCSLLVEPVVAKPYMFPVVDGEIAVVLDVVVEPVRERVLGMCIATYSSSRMWRC
jgi:hypothetical protein